MRGLRSWILSAAATLALPSAASAAVLVPSVPLASATNGLAVAADGNLWAGEQFSNSIVRLSPTGDTVLARYPLGGSPSRITAGPGGTIWVTVPSVRQIVWFSATSATPEGHAMSTGGATTCGPVAIVDGGNGRLFYSTPSDGICTGGPGRIGAIDATSKALLAATPNNVAGTVFDLEVAGGKLYAPDFDNGVIRRFSLGNPPLPEATIALPDPTSGPEGITVGGDGALWVTLWNSGQVARFPTSQNNGAAPVITPNSGALVNPFGIVASPHGGVLVASKGGARLVRVQADGASEVFPLGTGAEPFDLVTVPGGVWASDNANARLLHLVDGAPTATTVSATPTGTSTARFSGSFDTGGNDAQVAFRYGPTDAYGSTSAVSAIAASAGGATTADIDVAGLAPGTTYHVRARVTTSRGTVDGADLTFTTASGPGPVVPTPTPAASQPVLPRVGATVSFKSRTKGTKTTITALTVKGLVGGETITITCQAKKKAACPFKKATEKKVKKGSRSLTKRFGTKHPVLAGATVTVTVSATGKTSASRTLTIRSDKKPKSVVA